MLGLAPLVIAGLLVATPDEPAIANLKPAPTIASEYESRKAQTSRDADAQIKLALWCEQHGLEQERLKHLGAVVLRDPTNALARGLLGLVEYKGTWKRPEAVADAIRTDVAHADLLVEYNARRVKTPVAAGPQYKLGLWCEEKGLTDEARAHFATALRLEPTNAEALKKLGYKKVGNRWITERQAAFEKAERETQIAADREWRPRFETLRDQLKSKAKRADAEKALAEISHVRAVPMLLKTFAGGDFNHQRIALQVLGQIDAIESSRALARFALLAESDDIRARAIDTLRRRDPREWADLPITLLRSKIVYTMKPVGGPDDPGILDIKTKTGNYKRIYRPGVAYQPQPGDRIVAGPNGEPVVSRIAEVVTTPLMPASQLARALGGYEAGLTSVSPFDNAYLSSVAANQALDQSTTPGPNTNRAIGNLNHALQGTSLAGQGAYLATTELNAARAYQRNLELFYEQSLPQRLGTFAFKPDTYLTITAGKTINVPLAQLQRDAINSQNASIDQLNGDKGILDDANSKIARDNIRSIALLTAGTGKTLGDDREAWEKWLSNQIGYAYTTPDQTPTIVEEVPINYTPQAVATPGLQALSFSRISCFGKGTPVQTPSGTRPIEDLKVGDLVLSQEMATGKLRYKPVTVLHHNLPSPTYKVVLNGDSIISSYFHRFWKVGQGWVMARDLKVGDTLRVLGSVTSVTAIESAPVQPVFNLDVADDADFFVGSIGALVHDNSLPNLKLVPFDRVAEKTSK